MSNQSCLSCQKTKAPFVCTVCASALCKSCAQFFDEDSLPFLEELPKELKAGAYCLSCFETHLTPVLAGYEQIMERARETFVFFRDQSKETRLMKRTEESVVVENCTDKDEALLRIAFKAAQKNFNALVDIDISGEKVRHGGYQTMKWRAEGVPTQVDQVKHNR
jgi:hypothetical protein